MADDAQFDPLAGIITPQALQLQRMQQQQQALQSAAQAPAVNGRSYYGTRAAGLTLGNAVAQATNGGNTPLDNLAKQNASILNAPSGQGQQAPSSGDPMEDRARQYEQKAQMFAQAGQYDTAQKFVNAAQIVRKQAQDMLKSQAESRKDLAQGQEADANNWKEITRQNPKLPSGLELGRINKLTGQTDWTGQAAPPQVSPVSLQLKENEPFLNSFAGSMKKAQDEAQDSAQSLKMISDLRSKLDKGIIAGTGADFRTNLGNTLQTLGFQKAGANNPVANTQAFAQEALQMAIASRPTGQRLTQSEWNALKGMAGGDTSVGEAGLRAILKVRQAVAEGNIGKYNSLATKLQDVASKQKKGGVPGNLDLASSLYTPMDIPSSEPAGGAGWSFTPVK